MSSLGSGTAVAKRIEQAMLASLSLSSADTDRLFRELLEELTMASANELERIEIKRRSLEARIALLFDKADGLEYLEKAWAELSVLGYSSPEREATALDYRARAMFKAGRMTEFAEIVDRLRHVASLVWPDNQKRTAEHFLRVADELSRLIEG
jgi:hypothetical protein